MKQYMNFPSGFDIDTNIQMSEFNRIRIGGVADFVAKINSQKVLIKLLKFCRQNKIRLKALGEGSNVFFSDTGFQGLIAIIMFDNINNISENIISVEAGASLSSINDFCIKHQFTGFEFSTGIPGTVGGAIYGNAGAYGKNIGECLIRAKILTTAGKIKWIQPEDLNFSYRHSALKDTQNILLEAEFNFQKGDYFKIRERVDEIIKIREQKLQQLGAKIRRVVE